VIKTVQIPFTHLLQLFYSYQFPRCPPL